MIRIQNLTTGYDKEEILKQVFLHCEKGKISTLIGPNGCGKSTLLKTIIGMLPIKEGTIQIDGVSIAHLSERERAQKIAYLSQGKNVPDITVERMVLHGRFPYLSYPRKYRKCDYDAAYEGMKTMGILELAKKPLSTLSGGMRQKVYLAMALCQGADIILMDEPTTYLDVVHQMKIFEICQKLVSEGKTILMVSHDIISALKYSDYIMVMNEGTMLKEGNTKEIIESNIISDVFGVSVLPFEIHGNKEYYYKKGAIEE